MPGGERPAVCTAGQTLEADLVVGADGLESIVRRRLCPEARRGGGGLRRVARGDPLVPGRRAWPGRSGEGGETLGGGHRFRYALLGERGSAGGSTRGGVYWVATVPGAYRPEPPATQLALVRRWFADWHAPIGDLLAATEPGDLIQHQVGELRPLPRCVRLPVRPGRVRAAG